MHQQFPEDFRSGFVAIAGAPNVGKSTLLNRILGEKISITSQKPQTTRNRILGVAHRPRGQIIFIDTPGVHEAKDALNLRIVNVALSALADADIILLVANVMHPNIPAQTLLIKTLKKQKHPVILALNKIDLIAKPLVLKAIDTWSKLFSFHEIVPISARVGTQVERLLEVMDRALPKGPPYYSEETLTDMPERFIAAEIIREKVFRLTGQEIPYSSVVTIDEFSETESNRLIRIFATIHVERDSQKGILIGKNGGKLKQIGEAARMDIERMVGIQVFLKLFVRVQKNWCTDTKALSRFGY